MHQTRLSHEYKTIAAWGRMMGSFSYYIVAQQEKAAAANAPLDAIYERNGEWSILGDCHPDTQARVRAIMGAR